jgi:hypothetical protein
METGEDSSRQSSTSAARPENVDARISYHHNSHNHRQQHSSSSSSSAHHHNNNNNIINHNNTGSLTPVSEAPAHQNRDSRTMATSAVASPGAHPYPGPSSFHNGYPSAPPVAGMSSVISPIEPRRPSNDSEGSHRQSLPSLSEIMDLPPPSAPTSAPCQSSSTFPSPFNATPRTFSDPQHAAAAGHYPPPQQQQQQQPPQPPHEGHTSPRPIHPPPFQPRHDVDRFADARPPLGRPGSHQQPPPLTSYASPLSAHPTSPSRQLPEPPHRGLDHGPRSSPGSGLPHPSSAHSHSHSYSQHHHPNAPPPPPMSSYQAHPSQLPPGQLPLPRHPLSPSHASAQPAPGYEHSQSLPPARRYGEADYDGRSSQPGSGDQRLDWGYQENLGRIINHSRTIYNFAEAWANIAQEQQTSMQISQRLPTERELASMLNNVDLIRKSLEATRDLVQVTLQNERTQREAGKGKAWDEDHDMGYETSKYAMPEVKKRRGRAAPPGRCHSCNRMETPEWRRGPDGARTLCNACGLHYAKLERKRQSEMRANSRSKPMDD